MTGRPISPHLGIYRWYFTMALSIAHRVTGSANTVFLVFLTWWLLALASGEGAFDVINGLAGSILGQLVLFGYTYVVFFHMCNGIRHLVWDAGHGYRIDVAHQSGRLVLAAAAGLTILVWIARFVLS
jgi:succinate dehydrogenase / fumarate reductase, cytochrome b subunit